jgi:hypothetical protein
MIAGFKFIWSNADLALLLEFPKRHQNLLGREGDPPRLSSGSMAGRERGGCLLAPTIYSCKSTA